MDTANTAVPTIPDEVFVQIAKRIFTLKNIDGKITHFNFSSELYIGEEMDYEIAVLSGNKNEWNLCYDTKITSSVIGYLTKEEVEEYIKEIKEL